MGVYSSRRLVFWVGIEVQMVYGEKFTTAGAGGEARLLKLGHA